MALRVEIDVQSAFGEDIVIVSKSPSPRSTQIRCISLCIEIVLLILLVFKVKTRKYMLIMNEPAKSNCEKMCEYKHI